MSLKSKQVLLVCFVVVVVAGALIFKELISNRRAENDEYKLCVETVLKDAIREIKEIRGLDPSQVQVEVVTQSWVRENWGKSYAEADKEGILREERIYKALFMIPENASLYEAKVEWAGVTVAAVWQGKIYVVKDYFNPWDTFNAERTLMHELTHILQDKYLRVPDSPTQDGGKARSALIEGDACLMEEAYANKTKTHDLLAEITNAEPSKVRVQGLQFSEYSASIPDSISRLNYFPYEYGVKFARAIHAMGGWKTVNQAYKNPPETTEQIMHPEKYFEDETEKKVDELTIMEKGWRRVKNERLGEHFILVMLGNWIPWDEAQRAAEGWGGDNFTYYDKGEDYLFTWNITWDSVEEASVFYASFQEMMTKNGAEVKSNSLWEAHGRYLSLKWEGDSTLIISSTNEATVKKIADTPQIHGLQDNFLPMAFIIYNAQMK